MKIRAIFRRRQAVGAAVLTAAMAFGLCPMASADAPAKQLVTTLPMSSLTAWPSPLIQVSINGATKAMLIVDTGTTASAITDALAAQLNLTPEPYIQDGKPYEVLGKPAMDVILPTLEIGTFTFQKQRVLIFSHDDLVKLAKQPVDGIIGMDLLQHFAVGFDFTRQQLTLRYPGALSADQIAAAGFAGAASAPLTLQADLGTFFVHAQMQNGKQSGGEDLMVDTGSGVTALSHATAVQLGLTPSAASEITSTMHGDVSIEPTIMPIFQIGTSILPNFNVVYADKDGDGYNPLLGIDLLSKYSLLLDFPAKTMFLAAPSPGG